MCIKRCIIAAHHLLQKSFVTLRWTILTADLIVVDCLFLCIVHFSGTLEHSGEFNSVSGQLGADQQPSLWNFPHSVSNNNVNPCCASNKFSDRFSDSSRQGNCCVFYRVYFSFERMPQFAIPMASIQNYIYQKCIGCVIKFILCILQQKQVSINAG